MRIITALAAGLLALSTAAASAAPAMTGKTAAGDVLVNEKGMTLYTFGKDKPGTTNCYDKCATNWPPLMATANDTAEGDWTIVDRTDGTKMWAYKGQPLYLWVKDTKAGDTTGEGVGGMWHVAKP